MGTLTLAPLDNTDGSISGTNNRIYICTHGRKSLKRHFSRFFGFLNVLGLHKSLIFASKSWKADSLDNE